MNMNKQTNKGRKEKDLRKGRKGSRKKMNEIGWRGS